jgi:ketosteroid isomerase-like protein
MTTKELILLYFQRVKEKTDWQAFVAEDIRFESPATNTDGREAYVTAASRFFKMARSLEVKKLVVDGDMACAWVDYALFLNDEKKYNCLVAELLEVRKDKIISSRIMFDTMALKTFTSGN